MVSVRRGFSRLLAGLLAGLAAGLLLDLGGDPVPGHNHIIGNCRLMQEVYKEIGRVAATDAPGCAPMPSSADIRM